MRLKFLKFLKILAAIPVVIVMPVLGVLEYYSHVKMGMYRYVFMKNARLAANYFTPEFGFAEIASFLELKISVIAVISLLLILAALILTRRMKSSLLWRLYGVILAAAGVYIFQSQNFTPYNSAGWLTAPWCAIALLTAEILWLLASFYFKFCEASGKFN